MNHSSLLMDEIHQSPYIEEDPRVLTSNVRDIKKPLVTKESFQPVEQSEKIESIHLIYDKQQLRIVNDLACDERGDFKQEQKIKRKKSIVNQRRQSESIQKVPRSKESKGASAFVIMPEDRPRILWDLFTMAIIFITILILPLDISFTIDSDFFSIFNYLSIAVFSLDILINFNTAFQHKGSTIINRYQIASNYLKGWFWIDLLSTFPFDIIIDVATRASLELEVDESGNIANDAESQQKREQLVSAMRLFRILKIFRFIKVIRLLRILKLKNIFSKLEDYFDISQAMITLFQILKLTFIMLFVAHWLACIWHFIADQEKASDAENWISTQALQDSEWYVKYIASVYWATATMTTVGYGDIVPITTIEKIFGIVVMLLACCIFAYIMNSIGGIFVTMDQNEKLIRQKMGQANQFLKSNDIPKELQARVRKYLEYKYEKESSQVDEKRALQVLSSSLRDEVLAAVNTSLIEKSKIFKHTKFEREVLDRLPFLLEEQIYGPEECIFLEGVDKMEQENGQSIDERCLYFLNQGKVMICIQKTFTFLKELSKDETFGELAFFSNLPRSASAYTLDFVYLQKLRRKDYMELLKTRKTQNEHYQMQKHMIELNQDFSPLGGLCFGCQQSGHYAYRCPNLHFLISAEEKRGMQEKMREKERLQMRDFKRHQKVRYNARGCFALTKEVADEINYVYKQQDEEEKPRQEEVPPEENKTNNQVPVVKPEDDFERVCATTNFFVESNLENVIKAHNGLIDKKLREMKQDSTSIGRSPRSVSRQASRKWVRSNSAEKASYFEKLIAKYGGPDKFMDLLNQAE